MKKNEKTIALLNKLNKVFLLFPERQESDPEKVEQNFKSLIVNKQYFLEEDSFRFFYFHFQGDERGEKTDLSDKNLIKNSIINIYDYIFDVDDYPYKQEHFYTEKVVKIDNINIKRVLLQLLDNFVKIHDEYGYSIPMLYKKKGLENNPVSYLYTSYMVGIQAYFFRLLINTALVLVGLTDKIAHQNNLRDKYGNDFYSYKYLINTKELTKSLYNHDFFFNFLKNNMLFPHSKRGQLILRSIYKMKDIKSYKKIDKMRGESKIPSWSNIHNLCQFSDNKTTKLRIIILFIILVHDDYPHPFTLEQMCNIINESFYLEDLDSDVDTDTSLSFGTNMLSPIEQEVKKAIK